MALSDIASAVLQEYHEPVTGSTEMPLDLVYDKINIIYLELFNSPIDLSYYRESRFTFITIQDQTLFADSVVGATSVQITDSTTWPNATRSILLSDREFDIYTANTVAAPGTLSGLTALAAPHTAGDPVRISYPLSNISDIDEQELNRLFVDGIPYDFEKPEIFFTVTQSHAFRFTVFQSNLWLPTSVGDSRDATLIYQKKVVPMTDVAAKPTLIPPKWRPGLLVSGAISRLGVRDEMRTGWDWHQAKYQETTKMFYALGNNRIKSGAPILRPSMFD